MADNNLAIDEYLKDEPNDNAMRSTPAPKRYEIDEYLEGGQYPELTSPLHQQYLQDLQTEKVLRGQQKGVVRLKDIRLENYDIVRDEWSGKGTASFFAQSKAATQDTAEGKLKILAKDLFPNEPEAYKRFSMVDGIPIYRDDGGRYWAAARGDAIGTAREVGADVVAKSPVIAGDILAGAAAGKYAGVPGMVIGGMTGAMLGEYGRQKIGQWLTGEDVSKSEIAKEGAISGVTGGAGGLAIKWLERGAPKGWAESMPPIARAKMEKLDQISTRLGGGQPLDQAEQYLYDRITNKLSRGERLTSDEIQFYEDAIAKQQYAGLTPAEASNLGSLKSQQRFAGNVGYGADIVDDFLGRRALNNEMVWDNFTMKFGGGGIEEAGDALFIGAKNVVDEATLRRAQQAAPKYREAFKKNWRGPNQNRLREQKNWILSRVPDNIKSEAQAIYNLRYGKDLENIEDTLVGWHYMKLAIDDRIEAGFVEGLAGSKKSSYIDLVKDMVEVMDEASSLYKEARKIYADETPGLMKIREGILGRIFKEGERGGDAYKATMNLLDRSRVSPREVEFAMDKLRQTNPAVANQAVAAFLQVKFIEAARSVRDEWVAPRVARMLWKDQKQRAILKASMTNGQFKEFSDIMMFFEAQGRAPTGGSATAWNELEKAMAAHSGLKGRVAQVGELVSLDVIRNATAWLREGSINNWAEKVATAITSPNGMTNLRRLNKITDDTKRRVYKIAYIYGGSPLHAYESQPEDFYSWEPVSSGSRQKAPEPTSSVIPLQEFIH